MSNQTECYTDYSDERLMRLVKKHNKGAFTEIYNRYSVPLFSYFCRMLGGESEIARDFLQELFLKLINQPELYRNGYKFSPWIYRIAHNLCVNEYRRRKVRSDNQNEIRNECPEDVDFHIDYSSFQGALDQEMLRLSPEQRSVFILRFQENLSIREIHKVLNCSEGTVKSRLFYALKKLSNVLKDYNPIE